MKHISFLIPAAAVAVLTALAVVLLDLNATESYVVIGVMGSLILISGLVQDIQAPHEHTNIVKMHEAAIRAEQGSSPKATPGRHALVVERCNEEQVIGGTPFRVAARWTLLYSFRSKSRKKGVDVKFGHWLDPTPLTRM